MSISAAAAGLHLAGGRQPDRVWHYHDADGRECGAVLRWDLGDGQKAIRPLRFIGSGWVIGAMDEPRPLYRLRDLLAAHPDLAGKVLPGASIVNPPGDGRSDPNGHGTEMAERALAMDEVMAQDPRVRLSPNLIYQTPQGPRVVDLIKAPVYGADGKLDHILSIAQDVTEQRQTSEQLRLASRVMEETGDAVLVTDAMDRVVMANPAFLRIWRVPPGPGVIGAGIDELLAVTGCTLARPTDHSRYVLRAPQDGIARVA